MVRPSQSTLTNMILKQIAEERDKQHATWGTQKHDIFRWLAILGEEVGEACTAALEGHFGEDPKMVADASYEFVQIAAVAVAIIESIANYGFGGGEE